MPLKFDQTDEEREAVNKKRMEKVSIIQKMAGEVENWLELEGGVFTGISDEGGISFTFSDEAFQNLVTKIFKEESK